MRIANTSRYATADVERLVRYGMRGVKTTTLTVAVRNSAQAWDAMAYWRAPCHSPYRREATTNSLVIMRIGRPCRFPSGNIMPDTGLPYSGKSGPRVTVYDWQEAMVFVAAHEAMHIDQMQHGRKLSELQADRFGWQRVKEFRKSRLQASLHKNLPVGYN